MQALCAFNSRFPFFDSSERFARGMFGRKRGRARGRMGLECLPASNSLVVRVVGWGLEGFPASNSFVVRVVGWGLDGAPCLEQPC